MTRIPDCREFESKLDSYLDAELPHDEMSASAAHVRGCAKCDAIVTRYQETRALLTTAVAESAAAVDVSGLWQNIDRSLEPLGSPLRRRWTNWLGLLVGDGSGLSSWRLDWRMGTAAAFAAAAAVVVVGLAWQLRGPGPISSGRVATAPAVQVDAVEVAAGHTVTTWTRPRTHTRVIWVSDSNAGFGFTNVSDGR